MIKTENEIKLLNQDGKVVVSSRVVAQDFGKRHNDVLRAIESKLENVILRSQNYFIESTYKVEGNNKSYKEYLMTRDGFAFIVMGFTGSKADEFKLKYIEAFNKMEETIKNNKLQLSNEQKAILQVVQSQTQEERMMALVEYKDIVTKPLVEKIEELKPQADNFKKYMDSDGLITVTEVARIIGINRNEIFRFLREKEFVCKEKALPTVKGIEKGILVQKFTSSGYLTMKVTTKGVDFLIEQFRR